MGIVVLWRKTDGCHKYKMNAAKAITFKQFLSEDDLTDLSVDLFLRKKFGIGQAESQQLLSWLKGEVEYVDMGTDIWQHVLDHYADTMPYSVAKGDTVMPDEWVREKLHMELSDRGINVADL